MKYDHFLFGLIVVLFILVVLSYLGVFGRKTEAFTSQVEGEKTIKVYTAPNGATAVVKAGKIEVKNPDGTTMVYMATGTSNTGRGAKGTIYYGPDGGTATVVDGTKGGYAISVIGPDGGQAVVFADESGNVATASKDKEGNVSASTNNNNNNNNNNKINGSNTYDNYNHYDGTSYPTIFYGPNGATARVIDTNGDQTLVITTQNGSTEIYTIDTSANNTDGSVTTYVGKDGRKAVVALDDNGKYIVSLTASDGSKVVYTEDNIYTYNSQTNTNTNTNTNMSGSDYEDAFNVYYGPAGGKAVTATGPEGATAVAVDANTSANTNVDTEAYQQSLPAGIPRSQIPAGQEDLYILKSEVVPPVCPVCPNLVCPEPKFDETKCGPCPPCERVRTDDFVCKKVPNYAASNSSILPVPVISDFSGFGM